MDKSLEESFGLINNQTRSLQIQENELIKAGQIIRQQQMMLEQLIQYMKDIGEWPPKINPPNNSNRSEA